MTSILKIVEQLGEITSIYLFGEKLSCGLRFDKSKKFCFQRRILAFAFEDDVGVISLLSLIKYQKPTIYFLVI